MGSKLDIVGKSLKSYLASSKKFSDDALFEYEVAFQNNNKRGRVWNQDEINAMFTRSDYNGECGAAKVCWVTRPDTGKCLEYIVVKRHRSSGWWGKRSNQLRDEINSWKKLVQMDDSDYVCPILKWFTTKSDKVDDLSDTAYERDVIIAQKASDIGSVEEACERAEELNSMHGYFGIRAVDRYEEIRQFSKRHHMHDVMGHPENCGVIFDYSKRCYKAVIIDYAL